MKPIFFKGIFQWPLKRWGPYLQSCLWGFNMGKMKFAKTISPVVHYELKRIQVVSHMGNFRIGPWANFPQYMDPTFKENIKTSGLTPPYLPK